MIHPGKEFTARPTTDTAKESLFNILVNTYDLEEVDVLDLFAGTGSISYEFASRGSRVIEAVELNYKHASFIHKTKQELKLDQLRLVRANVFHYLKTCTRKFDIIFADPPYDLAEIETLPEIIFTRELLKDEGVFVLEHPRNMNFSNHDYLSDHRSYGSVNFSFFKKGKKI
jgi:16S rRNA (guanine966-N2)-methyltransferase